MTTTTVLEALKQCVELAQQRLLQPPSEFREVDFIVALGWIRDTLKDQIRAANAKPDQVDATAQAPYAYILKTGHGNSLRFDLKGVAPEFRSMWTPVYDHPAAVPQPAQAQQPIADEREALDDALDADAMLELRNRVLEEAAKACEATRYTYTKYNDEVEYNRACNESAAAIRSLQSPHPEVREQAPEKVGGMG